MTVSIHKIEKEFLSCFFLMCEIFQVNLGLENFIKCLCKIQELHGLKNLNNGVCLLEKVSS